MNTLINRHIALFLTILCMLGNTFATQGVSDAQKPAFTVVLDAGHGGKDPGAVGKISYEKDLNLAVVLKVGSMIRNLYPEVKIIYTRTTDEFLPLQKRADIVNASNADLFICVHTNSAEVKNVKGAETFVLGTDKMEQNLDVAMRENAVIKLESDYQTTYHGFDPNSIDSYIMFELMQNRYMDQSLNFATLVQQQFASDNNLNDRGVRQAAFWVLLKSACPSVLFEMGFISNPEEERYLKSEQGQKNIAAALVNAFGAFYKKKPVAEPIISDDKSAANEQTSSTTVATAAPQVSAPEVTTVAKPEQENVKQPAQENEPAEPLWAVQIFVSTKQLPAGDYNFRGIKDYDFFVKNGLYKYYSAASADKQQVEQARLKLKEKFPDCFVIKLPETEK